MKKQKKNSGRLTAAARRAQLIEVGRSVFAEQGFDATSVEELAARANVSKPILYGHFGGKEGLYSAVVDLEVEYIFNSISKAVSSENRSGRITFGQGDRLGFYPEGFGRLRGDYWALCQRIDGSIDRTV